ncbi:hypothetical protein, partial [Gilvimarinus sp. 1_MG-2023]
QLLRAVLLRLPAAELPAAVKPRRIVMCAGDNVGDTDADMNTALQQVAERLQAAGVEVTWLEAGTLLQQMVMHHSRIMAWE